MCLLLCVDVWVQVQIATLMQLQGSRADYAQQERLMSMLSEKNGEIQNLIAKLQRLEKVEVRAHFDSKKYNCVIKYKNRADAIQKTNIIRIVSVCRWLSPPTLQEQKLVVAMMKLTTLTCSKWSWIKLCESNFSIVHHCLDSCFLSCELSIHLFFIEQQGIQNSNVEKFKLQGVINHRYTFIQKSMCVWWLKWILCLSSVRSWSV